MTTRHQIAEIASIVTASAATVAAFVLIFNSAATGRNHDVLLLVLASITFIGLGLAWYHGFALNAEMEAARRQRWKRDLDRR